MKLKRGYCRYCGKKCVHERCPDRCNLKKVRKLLLCPKCQHKYYIKISQDDYKYYLKNGRCCKSCCSKTSSETFKRTQSLLTLKQKQDRGKYAHSCVKVDWKKTVQKSWDTIKADPKLWKHQCKHLKKIVVEQWKNMSPENRDMRIKAFLNPNTRSIGSEQLKQLMIKNNLYKGFKSEQMLSGFIPDELNKRLKLIVEYYGDIYHCNPRTFKDPNLYLKYIDRTVAEQWKRDRIRLGVFYKLGYTVVIVWESDFQKDPEKEIGRIKDAIEKQKNIKR